MPKLVSQIALTQSNSLTASQVNGFQPLLADWQAVAMESIQYLTTRKAAEERLALGAEIADFNRYFPRESLILRISIHLFPTVHKAVEELKDSLAQLDSKLDPLLQPFRFTLSPFAPASNQAFASLLPLAFETSTLSISTSHGDVNTLGVNNETFSLSHFLAAPTADFITSPAARVSPLATFIALAGFAVAQAKRQVRKLPTPATSFSMTRYILYALLPEAWQRKYEMTREELRRQAIAERKAKEAAVANTLDSLFIDEPSSGVRMNVDEANESGSEAAYNSTLFPHDAAQDASPADFPLADDESLDESLDKYNDALADVLRIREDAGLPIESPDNDSH